MSSHVPPQHTAPPDPQPVPSGWFSYVHWPAVQATPLWQEPAGAQSLAWQQVAPCTHAPLQHIPFVQSLAVEQGALTHAPSSHVSPVGQDPKVQAHAPETHAGVDGAQAAQASPQCAPSSSA
jgi:hypothetical protein